MSQFSRVTIESAIELADELLDFSNKYNGRAEVERFLLLFNLENEVLDTGDFRPGPRITALLNYLYTHDNEKGPLGANLVYEIIEYITERQVNRYRYTAKFLKLESYLKQLDGYRVNDDGKLEPIMPETMHLAEKNDELRSLLDKFRFSTAIGHLNQATSSFTRGEWASANGQLRTFVESLFNSIADKLVSNLPSASINKWEAISQINPPFFSPDLNEWRKPNDKGKETFVRGFFNRLHPLGPHPGLSEEEDCTFRLYLVTVVAWHYLRQLDRRI
jgi:hypothetical protein